MSGVTFAPRLDPRRPALVLAVATGGAALGFALQAETVLAGARLVALAGWSALVAADERAWGPTHLHTPLLAAGVAGWLAGDLAAGLWIGVLLQTIWPGLRPLGGARQPVVGLAALLAGALAAHVALGRHPLVPGVLLALAAGWAWTGARVEAALRRRNAQREAQHGLAGAGGPGVAGQLVRAGLLEASLPGPLAVLLFWAGPVLVLGATGAFGAPGAAADAASPWAGLRLGEVCRHAPAWGLGLLFATGGLLRAVTGEAWAARRDAADGARSSARERARLGPAQQRGRPAGPGVRRLWRLLALPASFSQRFLQRAGFLHALGEEESGDAVGELAPNTQPLLAAALLGAWQTVRADAAPPRPPLRMLAVGGSLLAQWGDRVIWGGARPLAALLALPAVLLSQAGLLLVWGCSLLAGEVWLRDRLYRWGRSRGWRLVPVALGARVQRLARSLPTALAAASAAWALLVAASWGASGGGPAWVAGGVWFIVGVLSGANAVRRPTHWAARCAAATLAAGVWLWLAPTEALR